jgi:hypothetical protein
LNPTTAPTNEAIRAQIAEIQKMNNARFEDGVFLKAERNKTRINATNPASNGTAKITKSELVHAKCDVTLQR